MFGTQLSTIRGAEAKGVVPSLAGQLAICMSTHPILINNLCLQQALGYTLL